MGIGNSKGLIRKFGSVYFFFSLDSVHFTKGLAWIEFLLSFY